MAPCRGASCTIDLSLSIRINNNMTLNTSHHYPLCYRLHQGVFLLMAVMSLNAYCCLSLLLLELYRKLMFLLKWHLLLLQKNNQSLTL